MDGNEQVFREMSGFFFSKREFFHNSHHRDGRIVQNSDHPVETSDLTGCLVQSESKSTQSVLNYEGKRADKNKGRKTPNFSVVSRSITNRFHIGLHKNFR